MDNCCSHSKTAKQCTRGNRTFLLPRKFSKERCMQDVKGFTMKSSCAPYKYCTRGIAILGPNKSNVSGSIRFSEINNGLQINYNIKGLSNGLHGFHIHEYGDLSNGCESACSHFNPYNKSHGGLDSKERHAGDLGNIMSKNNCSKGTMFVESLSLTKYKKTSVLGRMIVVHDKPDDLGKGETKDSLITGNAGKRLACGVIGLCK